PAAAWTLVRRLDNGSPNTNSLAIYRRVASAAEPASHSWTFSLTTGSAGGIAAFVGVDSATPIDVEDGQLTASALTHTAPSLTMTTARCMLFSAYGFASASVWTPAPGMTAAINVASVTPESAAGISICGSYELLVAAGATGTRTATATSGADVGNAAAVALRRAP
ncbi:MAG: hypothetical protein KDC98_00165, partial [Planctomycetes bacterium]|nr:hypothetical protein [Planctomycetota bacterium]